MKNKFALGLWMILVLLSFAIAAQAQRGNLLPHTPVKDQAMSSTCWCFATISFVESELMRQGKGKTDLSEMFMVRYVLVQKAIMHMRMNGYNFYTAGGQPHDVIKAIGAIGIMPETYYSGLGNKQKSHNHTAMDTCLYNYLKSVVSREDDLAPAGWLKAYQSIIDQFLGIPPDSFQINGKWISPMVYKQELGFKPDDYVEITSYMHHPYNQWFVLEDCYNWSMDLYFNVPFKDFSQLIDTALAKGYTLVYNGDISDPNINWSLGCNTNSGAPTANSIERQQLFDTQKTSVDHVMHLVGDTMSEGIRYYVLKNSWGDVGEHHGYVWFTKDFLLTHMVSLMVHRDALPVSIRLKLEQTEVNRIP